MFFRRAVSLDLALLLTCWPAVPQTVNTNRPSDIPTSQTSLSPESLRARLKNVQFQKELDELGGLYSSLASELNQVKEGILPKDLLEKMNHAEKISKRVRQELTQ